MAKKPILTVKEIESLHKAIVTARETFRTAEKNGQVVNDEAAEAVLKALKIERDEKSGPLEQLRNMANRSRIAVEKNLYIIPEYRGGSSVWRFHYTFATRSKDMSLGLYPEVSLALARERAKAANTLKDEGIDPSTARQDKRKADKEAAKIDRAIARGEAVQDSFRDVAEKLLALKCPPPAQGPRGWAIRTEKSKLIDLRKHLYPALATRPITAIKEPELLSLFQRIEKRGTLGAAQRARLTAQGVFAHAKLLGLIEHNPCIGVAQGLTGYESAGHPAPEDAKELRGVLLALAAYPGPWIVKAAMTLHIMLFQRPDNLCSMRWDEIDWANGVWVIPGHKLKGPEKKKATRPPHDVVLPRQALELLAELHAVTGSEQWVFPTPHKKGQHLSTHSLNMSLCVMGFQPGQYVPHGFRATAMTCGQEYLEIDPRVLNAVQAHVSGDSLKKAYNRAQWRHKLAPIMQQYADWLDGVRAGHEWAMHKKDELQHNAERAAMLSRIKRPGFTPEPTPPGLRLAA